MDSDYRQHMYHALGMNLTSRENGRLQASMEVSSANCQPLGFLCGGASIAMAEILAGMGSLDIVEEGLFPMGIQVSASHLRPAEFGTTVYADATLKHRGRTLHLWNVDITDNEGNLVSSIRVTNSIVKKHRVN